MPIRIAIEDGVAKVVAVCDHCAERIQDAKKGNYLWTHDEDGSAETGIIYTVHKSCTRAFEESKPDGRWGAVELQELPVYLARNMDVDLDEAADAADRL